MNYKMLAVDMDGTLLSDDKVFSDENEKAIRAAQEKGVTFVLATGRAPIALEMYKDKLPGNARAILFNGALAMTSLDGEVVYEKSLEPDSVAEVEQLADEFGIEDISLWTRDELYLNRSSERLKGYERISGIEGKVLEKFEGFGEPVLKMIWFADPERIDSMVKELEGRIKSDMTVFRTARDLLEFLHKDCSKAVALERLAASEGVDPADIVAIGDNFNDAGMIEFAGMGIAMGNSAQAIKDIANDVTASNNESGVALAVKKHILG